MFLPDYLLKLGDKSEANRVWLASLPAVLKRATEGWGLEVGDLYFENVSCSYVAKCLVEGKREAVLKIGLPHEEALHEIDGLIALNGNPTVEVLNFNRKTNAMLLERCVPGYPLKSLAEEKQDEVICQLLKKIWQADYSGQTFRPLSRMVTQWNEETSLRIDKYPDPVLAQEGCLLKEELIASTERHALLATDLHAGNVLKAQRKDWLAIDIKPYVGDPAYDLTQHLLNCKERLEANPNEAIGRLAELAMISPVRLSNWLFARLASENDGENQHLALRLRR